MVYFSNRMNMYISHFTFRVSLTMRTNLLIADSERRWPDYGGYFMFFTINFFAMIIMTWFDKIAIATRNLTTNPCVYNFHQLGAKGDVIISRGKTGSLSLPQKLEVGGQSIEDLIVSTIRQSTSYIFTCVENYYARCELVKDLTSGQTACHTHHGREQTANR